MVTQKHSSENQISSSSMGRPGGRAALAGCNCCDAGCGREREDEELGKLFCIVRGQFIFKPPAQS